MPVLSCLPTAVYFLIFAGSFFLPNSDTACLLFKYCYWSMAGTDCNSNKNKC